MKKYFIFGLAIWSIAFSVYAYTSPGKPTGFVNDFAGILSSTEKTKLETILSNFQKQSGNEVVIVTIPTLGDETVESYAVALFKEWGIGQKGKDNGVLILHSLGERKIRVEVGYGLEPYITDAKASSIYRNILAPAFKAGNYADGYNQAVTAIIATLNGQVDAIPQDTSSDGNDSYFYIIIIIFWFGSLFLRIMSRTKSWWLGGVIGAVVGIVIGFVSGSLVVGIISVIGSILIGLLIDYIVSKHPPKGPGGGGFWPIFLGGGSGGSSGGGFGGFGGGGSGGGGGGGGY